MMLFLWWSLSPDGSGILLLLSLSGKRYSVQQDWLLI